MIITVNIASISMLFVFSLFVFLLKLQIGKCFLFFMLNREFVYCAKKIATKNGEEKKIIKNEMAVEVQLPQNSKKKMQMQNSESSPLYRVKFCRLKNVLATE